MSYKPLRLIVSQIPEKIKGEQDAPQKKKIVFSHKCNFFMTNCAKLGKMQELRCLSFDYLWLLSLSHRTLNPLHRFDPMLRVHGVSLFWAFPVLRGKIHISTLIIRLTLNIILNNKCVCYLHIVTNLLHVRYWIVKKFNSNSAVRPNLDVITCSETQLPKPRHRFEHVIHWSTAEKITEGHAAKMNKTSLSVLKKSIWLIDPWLYLKKVCTADMYLW